jgi:tungstate transport system substrate-binding protein
VSPVDDRRHGRRRWLLTCAALAVLPAAGRADPGSPLRVAVVGGIRLCGVWDRLVPRIERATGVRIEPASAAPKEVVVPEFRAGRADLLIVHGGDETFALESEGLGAPLRVWAFNQHVVVGPVEDPAEVAGAGSAVEALARIARRHAPFLAFRDPGSHAIVQRLWKKGGVARPSPRWVLTDETSDPHGVLELASDQRAYVVVGHIPVVFGKLHGDGMAVLFSGDPDMRRAYVVVEPGPVHPADVGTRVRARQVADWLVSPDGQASLREADAEAGGPWIFPRPR